MKKLMAMILVIVAISIIPIEAAAVEFSREADIQRNIEMCQLRFPGCTVTVDEDDNLHVFVPYDYLSDLPYTTTSKAANSSSQTSQNATKGKNITPQSYYAPEGGTYNAYLDPKWATNGKTAYWPIYTKFFGKDESISMLHFRDNKELFKYIVKEYAKSKIEDLIVDVFKKFTVKIPAAGILLAAQLKVYEYVEWIEYADFHNALNKSTKSKVYCIAMNGLEGSWIPIVHSYFPWNSDYATDPCATNYFDQQHYNSAGPNFNRGVYK